MGWKKLLSEGSNGAIVISNTAATIEPAGDTTIDLVDSTKDFQITANGGNWAPVSNASLVTKRYIDTIAHEGTTIISTGETGGTKFLREDGDGTCSWQTPLSSGGSSFKKQYITGTYRWGSDTSPATSEFYSGYSGGYSRYSTFWGLNATNDTDITAYGWTIISYTDFLAHAPCTVTGFSAVARQDNSNTDVELCIFKGTITDNNSHTASQPVDFVGKLSWTANADTSSIHALQTTSTFDATAADVDAGDHLILAFRYTGANTDAKYWYINSTIEVTYD